MERSSRFRPPLRRLCSSTASERCFASADFLLMVLEHGGRRGRALDAPQVNGGGAGGFGSSFFVCVMRVAARSGSVCWVPALCLRAYAAGRAHALMVMRARAVRYDDVVR